MLSSMALMLNENLTEDELFGLLEKAHQSRINLIDYAKERIEQIECPEERLRMFNSILPVLIQLF